MSEISNPIALASYLPVIGPVIGFLNQNETPEVGRTYSFNAAVGSGLTVITAIALAAIGFFFTAGLLLGFGVVSFIHNVQAYNQANSSIEDATRKTANHFFAGTEDIPADDNGLEHLGSSSVRLENR